jgi:hypothetical protein
VRNGDYVLSIRHGDISESSIWPKISNLDAWTIDWNDSVDYHANFIQMVRACSSKKNTVHFTYSTQWTKQVKGASILDYFDANERSRILQSSNRALAVLYKNHLYLDFHAPIQNPFEKVNYALQFQTSDLWLKAVFSSVTIGVSDISLYSVLHRYPTLHVIFSADSNVSFCFSEKATCGR